MNKFYHSQMYLLTAVMIETHLLQKKGLQVSTRYKSTCTQKSFSIFLVQKECS